MDQARLEKEAVLQQMSAEKTRANIEKMRADAEKMRADAATAEIEKLKALLSEKSP